MSFTVTDAFIQNFTGVTRLIAQQENSRFRGKVIEDQITGESAYLEQLAPIGATKSTARHGDSPLSGIQHLRRRIAPYNYECGDLVDKEDQVAMLIDATSAYTRAFAAALERARDDETIGSFWSVAYTGHSGGTSVTWPNGNSESTPTAPAGTQVAVNDWTYGNGSGNAGLTISKLVFGHVALLAAEGDENEEQYVALGAKQIGNLLSTTEATLKEFGVAKEDMGGLRDGKVVRIVGFETLHTERNLTNGSGQFRIPAWRKSAMGMGIAQDISMRVAERPDKRFSWYVYGSAKWGGARMEEAKLAELICV